MSLYEDIPNDPLERAEMLESLLINHATGGNEDDGTYRQLRSYFLDNSETKELAPRFVLVQRNLDSFWGYIKGKFSTYAERREFIRSEFTQLIEHLEGRNSLPVDAVSSTSLKSFDSKGVLVVWDKAIDRRTSDPEGAITIARTLLETVTKRILDECQVSYTEKDDLPKLYSAASRALNLAPSQHTEQPIKEILGAATNLVNGLGTLRNRFSDAHGRGGRSPVRPSPRHASLAVNTAGAIATFLVDTFHDQRLKEN